MGDLQFQMAFGHLDSICFLPSHVVPTTSSQTIHHITASSSNLWTHISDPQTWLAYWHGPVIFCQILASGQFNNFWPLSMQPLKASILKLQITWVTLRLDYHTVMLQWKARLLLVNSFQTIVSASAHRIDSPNWPSHLISVPSCSSDFLPNFSLWFVDCFMLIISTTTNCIISIFKLWTHLSESHN